MNDFNRKAEQIRALWRQMPHTDEILRLGPCTRNVVIVKDAPVDMPHTREAFVELAKQRLREMEIAEATLARHTKRHPGYR